MGKLGGDDYWGKVERGGEVLSWCKPQGHCPHIGQLLYFIVKSFFLFRHGAELYTVLKERIR